MGGPSDLPIGEHGEGADQAEDSHRDQEHSRHGMAAEEGPGVVQERDRGDRYRLAGQKARKGLGKAPGVGVKWVGRHAQRRQDWYRLGMGTESCRIP